MNSKEAKRLIEAKLDELCSLFKNKGLIYSRDCVICTNTTEQGEEDELLVNGYLAVSEQPLSDDDDGEGVLLFTVDADLDENGECDGTVLNAELSALTEKAKAAADKINAVSEEEAKRALCLILAEEKAKEAEEYKLELERLNKATKRSLNIALIGAGLLVVVAALCLLIEKLF